jgi:hypothetical protein
MLTGDSPSGESIFVFKPDRPGSTFIGPIRQAARPLPATCHLNEARHAQSAPPCIFEAVCRRDRDRGDRHASRFAGQGLAGQGFERWQI